MIPKVLKVLTTKRQPNADRRECAFLFSAPSFSMRGPLPCTGTNLALNSMLLPHVLSHRFFVHAEAFAALVQMEVSLSLFDACIGVYVLWQRRFPTHTHRFLTLGSL